VSLRLLTGDCRDVLATLPAESVHCVVTSPPYWGLRDYGIPPTVWGGDAKCEHVWRKEITSRPNAGGGKPMFSVHGGGDSTQRDGSQWAKENGRTSTSAFCRCGAWRGAHGLEPTIDLYCRNAVEVFRAVHRVLRPDGTLWLNLGDSYGAQKGNGFNTNAYTGGGNRVQRMQAEHGDINVKTGLKPKDLCGIPWRVAFALQADGWWLRQDIVWHKVNPMPESVTDRCTKSHEYLFLLTKQANYFYDAEAIKEEGEGYGRSNWNAQQFKCGDITRNHGGKDGHGRGGGTSTGEGGRNKRSVWTVATSPFPEAHFATFPPELIEPCIKAGTSEKGCCAKCGAPWERVTKRESNGGWSAKYSAQQNEWQPCKGGIRGSRCDGADSPARVISTSWRPTCKCAAAVVPATVLDCFGGAGTTGLVADRLQRNAILIELNPTYAAMAEKRIQGDAPLFYQAAE